MAGLNELNLATFPTDFDIGVCSNIAADKADSLLRILGIPPQCLHRVLSTMPQLPSIDSWFEGDDGLVDEGVDSASVYSQDGDQLSEMQQLQQFLDHKEDVMLSHTHAQETALLNLTCASFALKADDMIKVQNLASDDSPEMAEQVASEEYLELQVATVHITNLVLEDQESKPIGRGTITFQDLDFNSMVEAKQEHETRQVVLGVHTRGTVSTQPTKATVRQQLICRFHEVLKESQDDIAIGTGLERGAQWKVSAKGGQMAGDVAPSRNTGNAIVVAAVAAEKNPFKRQKIFTDHKVPELGYMSTAHGGQRYTFKFAWYYWVSQFTRPDSVLTMYSRSGGENWKNKWVSTSSNISAISKLLVQVFEFNQGQQFTS